MALGTPTVLLNAYSSTGHGTGSYTTGATSAPAAGSKLIVHVSYITNGGGDPGTSITISDSGGHSWSEPVAQHRRAGSGSDWIGNAFFVADNASTSTITITVDTSAGNIYQWAVQVVQVTGGSGGTIGGKGSVSGTGNTGPSLTLDAAPASADITFGGLEAYEQSFPADPTPGSGFTELAQSGVQYASSQIQYRTASTSTTVAWADNGTSVAGYLGLGFVLKEAASGSTSFSDISIDGVTVTTPTGGQITVPAWAVAGDYVLCCSGGYPGDVTVPGDFAAVTGLVDYDGNNELRAYEKVLDSTDISNGYITVSGSAGWHSTSTIAIFFSGQDTTPVDGTPVTASGFDVSGAGYSTATWASMTPSADNSVTCWFAGVNSGGSWSATPTVDASWSYDTAMAVWGGYYEQTTAAATGAESIHHSVDYERWAAIGVVIRPATASGATGTGAVTTAAATSSASGTPKIVGTVARTLAAAAAAAIGSVTVIGSSTAATAAATSAAAGSPVISGAAAATLEDVTPAAVGSPVVSGACAAATDAATSSAAGSPVVTGTGASTAEATGSGAGSPTVAGSAGITSDTATSDAAGSPVVTGSAAVTADDAIGYGTNDTGTITGTGAATTADAAATASGSPVVAGTAAGSLDDAAMAGAGSPVVSGSGSSTTAVQVSGTGTPKITGSGATGADVASVVASGTPTVVGTSAVTLEDAIGNGSAGSLTGTGAATTDNATSSGAGSPIVAGSGSPGTSAGGAGVGTSSVVGTAAPTTSATGSGAGTPTVVGTGGPDTAVAAHGVGSPVVTGSGSVTLADATSDAEGSPVGATIAGPTIGWHETRLIRGSEQTSLSHREDKPPRYHETSAFTYRETE